jgi:hypothetical protein
LQASASKSTASKKVLFDIPFVKDGEGKYMLTTLLLPYIISANSWQLAPPARECSSSRSAPVVLLAKRRPPPEPEHGDDPNDEQHDGELPANQHARDHLPTRDPYAGNWPR